MLARQGATKEAVENARRFHEIALRYQEREPLDIEFRHASITSMPFLKADSFDAAVANYVLIDVPDYAAAIGEIARALKAGGRFVFTVMHGTMEGRWHTPTPDSPRREGRAGWLDSDYFVRRGGYLQWGRLHPVLTFHRPLRDYVEACKLASLELRDLEEPEITEEARLVLPAHEIRHAQRNAVSYVLKCVKRG